MLDEGGIKTQGTPVQPGPGRRAPKPPLGVEKIDGDGDKYAGEGHKQRYG